MIADTVCSPLDLSQVEHVVCVLIIIIVKPSKTNKDVSEDATFVQSRCLHQEIRMLE